jgi:sulfatase maturation enzyme AslB (radical SAM superfamily)
MFVVQDISPLIKGVILDDSLTVPKVKYRPLSFIVQLYQGGYYLLFNVLTKEFIALTHKEYSDFLHPKTNSPISLSLIKHLFLVAEDQDDIGLANSIRDIATSLKMAKWDGSISSFQIFTTTACNAHCPYCFERATPIISMSKDTADDIADFIIKKHNKKGIYIRWFGGEPLCNPSVINLITEELLEAGVPFFSALYTNGLLITEEIVSNAVSNWNLKTVQITIDGTEPVYNRIKACSIKNPFTTVLENIDRLLDAGIRVSIRTHITRDNIEDLENLFFFLSNRYNNSPLLRVYSNRLFSEQTNSDLSIQKERDIEQKHIHMCKIMEDLFPNARAEHLRSDIRTYRCFGDSNEAASILPDGRLLPCTHYDISTEPYGSIYDSNATKPGIWHEYYHYGEKCYKCFYYPDCFQLKVCPEAPPYCNDWRIQTRLMRIQRQMVSDWAVFAKKNNI